MSYKQRVSEEQYPFSEQRKMVLEIITTTYKNRKQKIDAILTSTYKDQDCIQLPKCCQQEQINAILTKTQQQIPKEKPEKPTHTSK